MIVDTVLELTDESFEQEVIGSEQLVLVDFWASWCAPCRALAPTINELSQQYAGSLVVAKHDVDAHPATPQKLGVSSIPTVILFKAGREVTRFTGLTPKHEYVNKINDHIAAPELDSAMPPHDAGA